MHILNRKKQKNAQNNGPFKLYAQSKITIINTSEVIVEGCIGVNEYYGDFISLKIPSGKFTVGGKNLAITVFDENALTIYGKIENMEF